MISFDLLSDGLIEPEGERGLGLFRLDAMGERRPA